MTAYRITGKTFQYRDTLKNLGGRWNAEDQEWIIAHASKHDLETLNTLIGVSVVPIGRDRPEPSDGDSDVDTILSMIFGGDDLQQAPIMRDGRTAIYGDDPRFLNTFKDQNPPAFFGFSSLGKLVDFVERIPSEVARDNRRNDGWRESESWTGSRDMQHAIRIARNGWFKGADMASTIAERLSTDHAVSKRRFYSTAGGSVSVGRMLSGNPVHMRKRPKQPGRKVVTIYTETFMSAAIEAENSIARAGIVAAMVDIAEREGYSCEVVAVLSTTIGSKVGHHATVTLKQAGERLNLNDIVFGLGHPSFFRRLMFACVASAEECRSLWSSQGMPAQAFNTKHPTKRNEFYIKQLSMGQQNRVSDGNPIDRALSMLDFVQPDNFLVEIVKQ